MCPAFLAHHPDAPDVIEPLVIVWDDTLEKPKARVWSLADFKRRFPKRLLLPVEISMRQFAGYVETQLEAAKAPR